jgi:hypothetical protein
MAFWRGTTYGWGDRAQDMSGIILFQRNYGGGDVTPKIILLSILTNAAIQR